MSTVLGAFVSAVVDFLVHGPVGVALSVIYWISPASPGSQSKIAPTRGTRAVCIRRPRLASPGKPRP